MTHDMRRKRQALAPEACADILAQDSHGVLALAGDDFPYAVPLSYVYTDGALYFHCAREGMKLELARRDSRASFCVVAEDHIVPEAYTTYYRSVICFGQLAEITTTKSAPRSKRLAANTRLTNQTIISLKRSIAIGQRSASSSSRQNASPAKKRSSLCRRAKAEHRFHSQPSGVCAKSWKKMPRWSKIKDCTKNGTLRRVPFFAISG